MINTTYLNSLRGIASITILSLSIITSQLAIADSLTVAGDLMVEGIATIGNNPGLSGTAGSIRWNGSALEVYDGTSWKAVPISVFAADGSATWGSSTNSASGEYSTVWGVGNTASGKNTTAWGRLNTVNGNFSNAWGKKNVASGNFSTVWGFSNEVSGLFATAWGRFVKAPASFSTVFGKFNLGSVSTSDDDDASNEGATVWMNSDPLIEVGAGGSNASRANALTLLKDGRIALGKHSTLDDLQNKPETLQVQGALRVGDYTGDPGISVSEGAIRFSENDLLGYVDGSWKSLTQGNQFSGDLQVDGDILLADHAGDIPSITY